MLGKKHSSKTKILMSKPKTEEHKINLSIARKKLDLKGPKNGMYGKPVSKETANKIRQTKKCIKLYCNETETLYDSIRCAAKALNISQAHLNRYIQGKVGRAKGYTFLQIINVKN